MNIFMRITERIREHSLRGKNTTGMRALYRTALPGAVGLLCAVCLSVPAMAATGDNTAADMRLAQTEGSVHVTNMNGRAMPLIADMRLSGGSGISTESASYAWINMDSSKLCKMDALSDVSISQNGGNLVLMLHSGNVYFNVSSPLRDDETLKIRTSTMVTGIRGTIGIVKKLDPWHEQVMVLEGHVSCEVTDSVTGQTKRIELNAGDIADFYVYEQVKDGDKCDIFMRRLDTSDVSGFAAEAIAADASAMERITSAGLDAAALTENAAARRTADEAALAERMAAVGQTPMPEGGAVVQNALQAGGGTVSPLFPEAAVENAAAQGAIALGPGGAAAGIGVGYGSAAGGSTVGGGAGIGSNGSSGTTYAPGTMIPAIGDSSSGSSSDGDSGSRRSASSGTASGDSASGGASVTNTGNSSETPSASETETPSEEDSHVHSYDAGVVTAAATCTETGTMLYTCTECGETKTETIAALGHTYVAGSQEGNEDEEPDCENAGIKWYYCTRCGDEKSETVAALGHDYVKQDGHEYDPKTNQVTESYLCNRDESHTYERTFAASSYTGHEFDDDKGTCTVCGYGKEMTAPEGDVPGTSEPGAIP